MVVSSLSLSLLTIITPAAERGTVVAALLREQRECVASNAQHVVYRLCSSYPVEAWLNSVPEDHDDDDDTDTEVNEVSELGTHRARCVSVCITGGGGRG